MTSEWSHVCLNNAPGRGAPRPLANGVILPSMTHRMGRKGQVVIPKDFRVAVGLQPGDEVTFSREGNAIRVLRAVSPDALMGRFSGRALVRALERDRQAERKR
jgi:AbrB family looped-hinge helix DNA binding protein